MKHKRNNVLVDKFLVFLGYLLVACASSFIGLIIGMIINYGV